MHSTFVTIFLSHFNKQPIIRENILVPSIGYFNTRHYQIDTIKMQIEKKQVKNEQSCNVARLQSREDMQRLVRWPVCREKFLMKSLEYHNIQVGF